MPARAAGREVLALLPALALAWAWALARVARTRRRRGIESGRQVGVQADGRVTALCRLAGASGLGLIWLAWAVGL